MSFAGLYLTLFLTPVIAFIFRKRIVKFNRIIFIASGIFLVLAILFIWADISFSRNEADALAFYFIYFLFGLCAFQLWIRNKVFVKLVGLLGIFVLLIFAAISIPSALGVLMAIEDSKPIFAIKTSELLSCRVTSFGNATTTKNWYTASIYRTFWLFERKVYSANFVTTPAPPEEITPHSICKDALFKLRR